MSNTRVLFSTHRRNLLSRLIRRVTGVKASHVSLLYYDVDWDVDYVMEATTGGVKLTPYTLFEQHNTIVGVFQPKVSLELGLRKAAREWVGLGFDYAGLFGMLFVYLGHWLRMKWRNPLASPKSMFCSEFVFRVMAGSDYPGLAGMDAESVSPGMLSPLFEGQPCTSVSELK